MKLYNDLPLMHRNTIDFKFDNESFWDITGYALYIGSRLAFVRIEESTLIH